MECSMLLELWLCTDFRQSIIGYAFGIFTNVVQFYFLITEMGKKIENYQNGLVMPPWDDFI